MSVDFGLICLFALQAGMVMAVYHAWRGIKAEISALEALRRGNAEVASRVDVFAAKMDAQAERISALESAPKAARNRLEEFGEDLKGLDRKVEAVDTKVVSLAARLSAYGRKRKEVEEETDPAPQGEGEQMDLTSMPPGSIRLAPENQPPQAAVPPGFGVVRRRQRNG